ncbi:hypothetical protein GIB67_001228 [Kingdonia uniflora]|uniref:DUF8039 domain-containing protein n=1 Tax=Kingdonia uniflora TaxID=39325 RepID=A0A7J7LG95_9MAGN|nr:hypothetical protein GIB67_001228 [Kingdonia uniflora]
MIMKKRPKEIDLKEWNFFVKGKSSPVFKAKSKKFKNMRSKQVFPYTGSRRGYARLENDMKKKSTKPSSVVRVDVWAKAHAKANGEPSNEEVAKNLVKIEELKTSLPLNSTSPPLKDDMLSQVLGPERRGQGQSMGDLHSSHAPHSLSQENYNAQSVSEVQSVADDEVLQTQTSTPQAQRKRKAKDTNCKLLSWKDSKVIIAHAQWMSDDPECMLHNQILGPNVCKVAVMNVVIPLFPLWRVTDEANTIGGALKSFIAWPKKYVVMKDDWFRYNKPL